VRRGRESVRGSLFLEHYGARQVKGTGDEKPAILGFGLTSAGNDLDSASFPVQS
jgi:hypothetical protein